MSSIARLETTYAYNKKKVVIDVADLMNTDGYYEAIAMSPDGRIEYDLLRTKDKQEAMTPGDLVTYDCATATVRREQVDVRQYRAWIDGVIRYDAITLPSLLRRLAREYDVEIDLRTRRFDDTTFRISLSSAQNIKSVMRALCDILPISVSCEGCRYVVDALPQ